MKSTTNLTLSQKVMLPVNDLMHALATQPMLMRLFVFFTILAVGQVNASADNGLSSLKTSFGTIMFIAMLIGGVLALVLFIQGGVAIKRGEEGYLHIIGGFIIGAAPALTYYMMQANGLTGAAISTSDINSAANATGPTSTQ